MLRDSPHLSVILDSFRRYQQGELSIADLELNLGAVMTAMEGDVPKDIRDAVFDAETQVDSIRFMVPESRQSEEIGELFRELEAIIARHDPPHG